MRTSLVAAGLSLALFRESGVLGQCFAPPEVLTPALATSTAMTWWDSDGDGPLPPKLVVSTGGTQLGAIGGVLARFAAAWDGERWESLDADMGDRLRNVGALGTVNGELYIAGNVTLAGGPPWLDRVLKWNGSGWETVADTYQHEIRRIVSWGGRPVVSNAFRPYQISAFDGNTLVPLGGAFDTHAAEVIEFAGDLFVIVDRRLRRWNGAAWEPFGPVVVPTCAAVFGDSLYVGGSFGTVQGIPGSARLLRWNGSEWSGVGGGFVGETVSALSATGQALLAIGRFSSAGGVPAVNVAAWDGNQWRTAAAPGAVVGDYSPPSSPNQFIASSGEQVALQASRIRLPSGTAIESQVIGIWDGAGWSLVGNRGLSSRPSFVREHGGSIFAAGEFSFADGPSGCVARFVDGLFAPVGQVRGNASAFEAGPQGVYVAGQISVDDSSPAWRVARLDGATWTALGGTWNQSITSLVSDEQGLYIGGSFSVYNNAALRYVAQRNGQTWSAVPGYPGSLVGAVARFQGELIVGESAVSSARVFAFDGTTWRRLGGILGPVTCFATFNDQLFVGVDSENGLLRWNGVEWQAVARSGRVSSLAQHNGILYMRNTNGTTSAYRDGAILPSAGTIRVPFAALGDDVYSVGNFLGQPGTPAGVFARIAAPCLADYNRDGMVDCFDYDEFVACFEGGGAEACPEGRTADADGNGFVDFFDYAEFVAQFSEGC